MSPNCPQSLWLSPVCPGAVVGRTPTLGSRGGILQETTRIYSEKCFPCQLQCAQKWKAKFHTLLIILSLFSHLKQVATEIDHYSKKPHLMLKLPQEFQWWSLDGVSNRRPLIMELSGELYCSALEQKILISHLYTSSILKYDERMFYGLVGHLTLVK